jgi:hypothetical protein
VQEGHYAPVDGRGVVYVYRPWAFAGSGVGIGVLVNDVHVANIRVNNYIRLELPEGDYHFRIGVRQFGMNAFADKRIFVEPGQMYFIKADGSGTATNATYAEAMPVIQKITQVHTAY